MNILIVDDEPLARARLRSLIDEIGTPWQVVDEACNGEQLLTRCALGDIDLVLLDIRMPGMDGLAAAQALLQLPAPPTIIYTTAYSESALEAFEQQAVDYLLKPIRRERLESALRKARTLSRVQLQTLQAQSARTTTGSEGVCVRYRGALRRITIDEIYCFLADSKYVLVRHKGGESLLEESLTQLEQRYAGVFLRIHRNALINLQYLKGIRKSGEDEFHAELGDDTALEISRRHLSSVRKWLKGE